MDLKRCLHLDPFNKNLFFICYTDIGLCHTLNGGQNWFHSITNIPEEWLNTCYQAAFDPDVRGKVWSVWANVHDLTTVKMFGRDGFSLFSSGVANSDDSGRFYDEIQPDK
jgi:hypothetical protein